MNRELTGREKVMLLILSVLVMALGYYKLIFEPINDQVAAYRDSTEQEQTELTTELVRAEQLWLLRDGALWEQVILTEDDHWCRTWNGLEPGHRWQVTEPEVPEGYTVSVSRQRELFAVTNSGEAAGEEPAPLGGLLPQTGQLWWPAILLAALGLLLLLRAFRLRRRK